MEDNNDASSTHHKNSRNRRTNFQRENGNRPRTHGSSRINDFSHHPDHNIQSVVAANSTMQQMTMKRYIQNQNEIGKASATMQQMTMKQFIQNPNNEIQKRYHQQQEKYDKSSQRIPNVYQLTGSHYNHTYNNNQNNLEYQNNNRHSIQQNTQNFRNSSKIPHSSSYTESSNHNTTTTTTNHHAPYATFKVTVAGEEIEASYGNSPEPPQAYSTMMEQQDQAIQDKELNGSNKTFDVDPNNNNVQHHDKIAKRIPGCEKIQLEIGRLWEGTQPVWKKVYDSIESFQPIDDSITVTTTASNDSTDGAGSSMRARSAKELLDKVLESRKKKSKADLISSRMKNGMEPNSCFEILSYIENEILLLLDLTSVSIGILDKCTDAKALCDEKRTEMTTFRDMLKDRISETKSATQELRPMTKNATIQNENNLKDVASNDTASQQIMSMRKRKHTAKLVSDMMNKRSDDYEKRRKRNGEEKLVAWSVEDSTRMNIIQGFDETKRPIHSTVKIIDDFPKRITNPLLEMPHYRSAPKGFPGTGSLPIESIPQGSEFWKPMQLYFPIPDTFPLSYIGRILGFDAELANQAIENREKPDENIDLASLLVKECQNDNWKLSSRKGQFSRYLECLGTPQTNENTLKFHEIDPMWKAIMEQYRGFRDDLYKPSPEVNKGDFINDQCIKFASRLKIIDDDFIFRPAKVDDVKSLTSLYSGNNLNDTASDNTFANLIKCGTHFIIVAESKEKGIVGYVHYRFCWFRQKQDRPTVNLDPLQNHTGILPSLTASAVSSSMAERILFIEDVKYADGLDCKTSCVAPLILVGLALDHSRQYAVYGVMDTHRGSVPFFKNYFRMSVIDANNTNENDDFFLGIDLEGCNYRYAFLKKEQEMLQVRRTEGLTQSKNNERMLVVLPTSQDVSKCYGNTNALSNLVYTFEGSEMNHTKEKCRNNSALIKVRLDRSNGSVVRSETHSEIISSHQECLDLTTVNWEILRSFHLPSNKINSIMDNRGSESITSLDAELEILQKQLTTTERDLLPSLWELYKKCYQERKTFELEYNKRKQIKSFLEENDKIIERRQEEQRTLEQQIEQEENAVCDVCYDGESTGENRIIFCDSCNVSVHQQCYGIEKVPSEDYFCHACAYSRRVKIEKSESDLGNLAKQPQSVYCEVCPQRKGAFIETYDIASKKKEGSKNLSKWVHVVCAKWHGFRFVDKNTGEPVVYGDIVEDVTDLKNHFRFNDIQCSLCLGMRGCYIKCKVEKCEKYMHVTCARSSGLCNVNHGNNHLGTVETEDVWTLTCPDHSFIDSEDIPAGTAHLIALAKTFPTEPKPPPPPKHFNKLTKKERDLYFSYPEFERESMELFLKKKNSSRCEVCFLPFTVSSLSGGKNASEEGLMRCHICNSNAHEVCVWQKWKVENVRSKPRYTCIRCQYVDSHHSNEDFIEPQCHMCNDKHGTLYKAKAHPTTMKTWKKNLTAFKKSLFGRQIWCHPICAMHPKLFMDDDKVFDCSNIICANGHKHVESKVACDLCGISDKMKVQCKHPGCKYRFHVTCARQAGLEVREVPVVGEDTFEFTVKCYQHSACEFAFRAVLEDMLEIELVKSNYMTIDRAAGIVNWGISILNILGWAWKWASWWVNLGDTWEPLLEDGQKEEDMTKEELKIVESTPYSRCEDARRCRLVAFGAALRNRDYDKEDGDDHEPLERALRAVLSTPSLVGPLKRNVIEFFVSWLARIYRSKTPLLRLGENAIPVSETESCNIYDDKTPKYILGNRRLPGKQKVSKEQIFETDFKEIDDFSVEELPLSILLRSPERLQIKKGSK